MDTSTAKPEYYHDAMRICQDKLGNEQTSQVKSGRHHESGRSNPESGVMSWPKPAFDAERIVADEFTIHFYF